MIRRVITAFFVSIIIFAGNSVFAITDYPATANWSSSSGAVGTSANSLCAMHVALACTTLHGGYAQMTNASNAQCFGHTSADYPSPCGYASATFSCPNGGTLTDKNGAKVCVKSCTAPEVLQPDGTCKAPVVCNPGQSEVNGVCVCSNGAQTGDNGQCCPVAGSGGGAPMQWCYVDSSSATSCDSAGTNGCKVRCNNVTFQKGAGLTVQIYPKQALGQSCSYTGTKSTNQGGGPLNNDELKEVSDATKDPAKAKSPESCLAAGMGYVTGSTGTNCVPGGDTGVTKKESESSTKSDGNGTTTETKTKETEQTTTGGKESETVTKTNPDGTTTTTTKKTTCADDGTCKTETTETTKDANGNTTGTKGGTDEKSSSSFCKENPSSELCKGNSDTCKDHPDRIGCGTFGEVTEQADLATVEKGISSITVAGVASNASCPADLTLAHGMSFSFAPFCNYATAFSPIIITLAWLSAGFLIFGFKD